MLEKYKKDTSFKSLNVRLSSEENDILNEISDSWNTSNSEVLRVGLKYLYDSFKEENQPKSEN